MTCLIGSYNFLNRDLISSYSFSSGSTEFPGTNLINYSSRSKVWRSAGYFDITSSNNVLIIREAADVDLTATVAAAEYTSTTDLCTAIKTALDAAGAYTYTVSFSNAEFTIAATDVFKIMTTDVLSTLADVIGFDTATDKTGADEYTADESKIHTSEFITFDLGLASNPDLFCLTSRRDVGLNLTNSAVIKLRGNSTSNFSVPDFEATLTLHDSIIVHQSSSGFGSYRYWQVHVVDSGNPDGYIEFGAIFLGNAFRPSQGFASFPLGSEFSDLSINTRMLSGVIYSEIKNRYESFAWQYEFLSQTEREDLEDFIRFVGTSRPFFMVLDPNSAYSSANYMAKYCRFASLPSMRYERFQYFSESIEVEEDL